MEAFARLPEPLEKVKPMDKTWKLWKESFLIFLNVAGFDKKDSDTKANFLKNIIGKYGQEEILKIEHGEKINDFETLVKKLDDRFNPPKIESEEHFKFFSRSKKSNESIESFVNDLREKAGNCNFGNLTEILIRDMVILNVKDKNLEKIIFKEKNLNLNSLIVLCKLYETNNLQTTKNVDKKDVFDNLNSEAKNSNATSTPSVSELQIFLNKIESDIQSQEKPEQIFDTLIKLDYDGLSTDSSGVTPLMYAVKFNCKKLMDLLLNHFKDIDIKNRIFSKPVNIEHEVGNTLFDEAANTNSKLIKIVNKRDHDNKSALNYALENKYYDIACILVLHGADVSFLDENEKKELLLYSDEKAYRQKASLPLHELHELHHVVGLLSTKVPTAVSKYSNDYRYPRLLSYFSGYGHSKVVSAFLDSIESEARRKQIINSPDNGSTQLARANNSNQMGDYDHLQMVKYLFEHGAEEGSNPQDDPIYFTLVSAASKGHIETFKYLDQKAKKKDFNTFIGLATKECHIEIIKYIWNKYRKYTIDGSRNTALHYATWKGNLNSVKYLCENGAEINPLNRSGETPLDNAIMYKHKDVIVYLINEHDARVGLECNKSHYTSMKKLLCDQNNIITEQLNKLLNAIKSGDIVSAKHFVTQGTDINKSNVSGVTPLHLAVQNSDDSFTKLLLQNGVVYSTATKDNKTALELSKPSSRRILNIIDNLFRSDNLFKDLETIITSFSEYEDPYDPNNPMVFLMNVKDHHGQTLLHKAVVQSDEEAVKLLLDHDKAYIHICSTLKMPHAADYVPINISQQDIKGNTALHLAAYGGNDEIVKILIKENPDFDAKNNFGQTPVFIAEHHDHKSIVELLVQIVEGEKKK